MTKGRSILLLTAVAAAVLLMATQTWVNVRLPDTGVTQKALTVAGTDASRPITALAVVAMAASVASAVAGRIARTVSLALVAVSLGIASALAFVVIGDPTAAASTKIAERIGLSGETSGATAQVTAWPAVAGATAALGALLALAVLVMSRRWTVTAKYQAAPQDQTAGSATGDSVEPEPGSSSGRVRERGGQGGSAEDRREAVQRGSRAAGSRQAQSIDDWDDLTRGDDPTA
ncbi:Trp biosynthesis-associated membrane protein [Arthrobacter sp. UM1]|uniref:Trp biosynthesis-associated membrane protein n=1 Tax=Arthrobacter sp. UM1 TaxID=2766776 RepID=UPI001CF6CE36|nr:Trp biosynthesis-associated membrane protein [Arthrobacter sp. UM1]MCB4207622.1 Trp biosynthesis-associated membrane protein [Arthrobacter sp. UM1]